MARTLVVAFPATVLEVAPPSIILCEIDQHRQDRLHVTRLICGYHQDLHLYENSLHAESYLARMWCDSNPETVSHFLQLYPQWTEEQVECGVSNQRDFWNEPEEVLRFLRAIRITLNFI